MRVLASHSVASRLSSSAIFSCAGLQKHFMCRSVKLYLRTFAWALTADSFLQSIWILEIVRSSNATCGARIPAAVIHMTAACNVDQPSQRTPC